MDKLTPQDGQSLNIVADNIERLREIFPTAFAEGRVDFEALKQCLGECVDERTERYSFTWHGKRCARRIAQTPSAGTLLPCPDESLNWDSTQNIFIEGDNLEVLKLLQKSYHRKVKMIYIDPPYNTGKEFIYPDNYQDNLSTYLKYTGQIDGEGFKLSPNTESGGRYHTNWLNMMYPRLTLARSLLRDDGVMFVSIDDHEVHNLRYLMDEIFGEENFLGVIKRRAARKTAFLSKRMTDMCDYIVAYARSEDAAALTAGVISDGTRPVFNHPNSSVVRILRAGADAKCTDGHYKTGTYSVRTMSFELLDELWVKHGKVLEDVRIIGRWRINQDLLDQTLFVTRNFGFRRTLLPEELGKSKLLNDLLDNKDCYNEKGSEEINELLAPAVFSNPKPSGLLKYLIASVPVGYGEIVLDFFAGSGTTGSAVASLNSQHHEGRYILVQLPEPLNPQDLGHTAAIKLCKKNSRPANIAEIAKARLRVAASTCAPKSESQISTADTGFKVFKLSSSNIKPWDPDCDAVDGALLDAAIDNIKPERSQLAVLYELLLKYGLDLASAIEIRTIADRCVFIVANGALVVCLERGISLEVVRGIAALKTELQPPLMRVVFRDSCFDNDVLKTNTLQILTQAGIPHVKSL